MIRHSTLALRLHTVSDCVQKHFITLWRPLNVISQAWLVSLSFRFEFGDDTNTQTLTKRHASVSSTGVLPRSKHWFALRSEPQTVDCRCGQRGPARPGWCWETHRSLHTHQVLKETLSTVWKGENKQEHKGYLSESIMTCTGYKLLWVDGCNLHMLAVD